jgi:hypothetical protein
MLITCTAAEPLANPQATDINHATPEFAALSRGNTHRRSCSKRATGVVFASACAMHTTNKPEAIAQDASIHA